MKAQNIHTIFDVNNTALGCKKKTVKKTGYHRRLGEIRNTSKDDPGPFFKLHPNNNGQMLLKEVDEGQFGELNQILANYKLAKKEGKKMIWKIARNDTTSQPAQRDRIECTIIRKMKELDISNSGT